jgi:hypothetical protein
MIEAVCPAQKLRRIRSVFRGRVGLFSRHEPHLEHTAYEKEFTRLGRKHDLENVESAINSGKG